MNKISGEQFPVLVFGVVGGALGVSFADWDQYLPLLHHRDILTHGVLLPVGLWFWALKSADVRVRLFTVGFVSAVVGHLCFDLYPVGWRGYALIHVLGWFRLPPVLSWLWIAGSIVGCAALVLEMSGCWRDYILGVLGAGVTFWVYGQEEAIFLPLLTLLAAVGVSFWLQRAHLLRRIE